MTPEQLKKLFDYYAEETQFQNWNTGVAKVRFVYACEYGTIWKFTPKEWWQAVRKAIRNQGSHEFILSKALRNRPKFVTKGDDGKISSSDSGIRCVNPLDWTFQDWTDELARH
jgi:hypothetical protein